MAEDNDLIDEEPSAKSEPASQRQEGAPNIATKPASRRAFLFGAAAGGVAGVAAGGVIAGLGAGGIGAPGSTTGGARGGAANEPIDGKILTLNINGRPYETYVRANQTLLEVLRQNLGLTGSKLGCNYSECSACSVLIEGAAVNSCSELAIRLEGKKIITIEGLEKDGVLHPVQVAYWDNMGMQCGFCTPGQIIQTVALLTKIPNPTDDQIRHQMSGNLCKCSAYPNIMASVRASAKTFKA